MRQSAITLRQQYTEIPVTTTALAAEESAEPAIASGEPAALEFPLPELSGPSDGEPLTAEAIAAAGLPIPSITAR